MSVEMLVTLALKSTIVAVAALAARWLLRQRPTREQVAILCAATLVLFALPWATLLLPSLDIAVAAEAAPPPLLPVAEHAAADPLPQIALSPASLSPSELIVLAYIGGALFFMARLVIGLLMLVGWTRRSMAVTDAGWLAAYERGCAQAGRRPRLLVSSEIASPLSWGVWPGDILIDRKTLASPERADAVIAHELAHVRGLDWPVLLMSRVATVIFWFNPFVWLVERALSRRAELAADEDAASRVERFTYAQMLLDVANEAHTPAPACGMASPPSLLAERVRCILTARRPRPAGRIVPLAIIGSAALASMPLAAARLVEVPPAASSAPLAAPAQAPAASAPASPTTVRRAARSSQRPARPPRAEPVISRPVSPPASPPASLPVDERQAAWEMTEQARELRRRAAILSAASKPPRPGPARDPPEPARALRVEADRLDMAARRLIFGP